MFKDLKNLNAALAKKDENFWLKAGEKMALRLFREASKRVPAYRDFLKSNKINPAKIKTIIDFSKIPSVDKKNYLLKYPLEKLCWDGKIEKADMISLSSGSSGDPFFWLRDKEQEEETALSHEAFLVDSFGIDKNSTLLIVSFAMGMWVAGTLTYRAVQKIAENYRLTVITPGINKQDVLNVVRKIGNKYKQIVIAGFPPFVKDIIDEGERQNIDWKKHKIKFLFAAEAFSEKWRDYMYKKIGAKNPLKDSLNIYGTADALILGHETPLSILIRRLADKHGKELYRDLFKHDERVPTLVQYNPALRYLESVNGNLIFSAFSGIPLVRYAIGDTGDATQYSKVISLLKKHDINMDKEVRLAKISNWKLPFLYVYGRNDFTASLYGINIHPENIRDALSDKEAEGDVSGKFVMFTGNDGRINQYLKIVVELKDGVSNAGVKLEERIKSAVVKMLKEKNMEYNELYKSLGVMVEPQIKLYRYGHEDFFKPGIKQK